MELPDFSTLSWYGWTGAGHKVRIWPGALGGHRQLLGSEIQWLFSGGELEGFNFGKVPIGDICHLHT